MVLLPPQKNGRSQACLTMCHVLFAHAAMQGDQERAAGLPVSAVCDREKANPLKVGPCLPGRIAHDATQGSERMPPASPAVCMQALSGPLILSVLRWVFETLGLFHG